MIADLFAGGWVFVLVLAVLAGEALLLLLLRPVPARDWVPMVAAGAAMAAAALLALWQAPWPLVALALLAALAAHLADLFRRWRRAP